MVTQAEGCGCRQHGLCGALVDTLRLRGRKLMLRFTEKILSASVSDIKVCYTC